MNEELETKGQEASVPQLIHSPVIGLEGLEKSKKTADFRAEIRTRTLFIRNNLFNHSVTP